MYEEPIPLARSLGFALGLLVVAPTAMALDIVGENATDNYRFASGYPGSPVPNTSLDFVAAGYDLSGVGWGSASNQSFTMIDDEYFVFATHYPPFSSDIHFYSPTLDAVVDYTIDTGSYIALSDPFPANPLHDLKSDLSIGKLTTSLNPAHGITSYAILDLDLEDYTGLDLLVYGFQAAVGTGTFESAALANLYWDNDTPFDASDDVLNTEDDNDSLTDTVVMSFTQGVVDGEAKAQPGDSGSPTFAIWEGKLALVGTHSTVEDDTTYDTFVPAYISKLEEAGATVTTVPEPSSLLLIFVSCALGAARFRHRSRR